MNNHVTKANWCSPNIKITWNPCDTNAFRSDIKRCWNSQFPLPKWPVNLYQHIRSPLWPAEANWCIKNPLKHSKNTYVRQAPWMLPSVSIHTNNRQECFAPFRKSKRRHRHRAMKFAPAKTHEHFQARERPGAATFRKNLGFSKVIKMQFGTGKAKV